MARHSMTPSLLTTGSVPSHLKRLALLMVIGVFAMISVNLIDTYFVGLLGTDQLAAMSFTFFIVALSGQELKVKLYELERDLNYA